jgi:hypothetical protein
LFLNIFKNILFRKRCFDCCLQLSSLCSKTNKCIFIFGERTRTMRNIKKFSISVSFKNVFKQQLIFFKTINFSLLC